MYNCREFLGILKKCDRDNFGRLRRISGLTILSIIIIFLPIYLYCKVVVPYISLSCLLPTCQTTRCRMAVHVKQQD